MNKTKLIKLNVIGETRNGMSDCKMSGLDKAFFDKFDLVIKS